MTKSKRIFLLAALIGGVLGLIFVAVPQPDNQAQVGAVLHENPQFIHTESADVPGATHLIFTKDVGFQKSASEISGSLPISKGGYPPCTIMHPLNCNPESPPPPESDTKVVMNQIAPFLALSLPSVVHASKGNDGYSITVTYPYRGEVDPQYEDIYLSGILRDAKKVAQAYITELVREGFDPSMSGGHPAELFVSAEAETRTATGKILSKPIAYADYDPASDTINSEFYK